jgi:outer membrane protein OmpA-like peptidoglycan-associated protein
MTRPGSAHLPGGALSPPRSPVRLVLAGGLLALGVGDLAVVNSALLPAYVAGERDAFALLAARSHRWLGRPGAGPAAPPPAAPERAQVVAPPPAGPAEARTEPAPVAAPAVAPAAVEPPEPARPPDQEGAAAGDSYSALLFVRNSTWLSPGARETLDQVAAALAAAPARRVMLGGHSDRVGAPEFNRQLSLLRARRAGRYLQEHGIERGRIEVKSFGSDQPADEEPTPAARARNRRVEIEIH